MEQKQTVSIKNLNISRFEKFLLALVKSYPEAKKQKDLAREAGIYESEISRWRKREKKRGESYVEFFKEYIDIDPKTLGFKLKLHINLVSKLIEIAKKDKKAREIISNSRYLDELLRKCPKAFMHCVREGIINQEKAKEILFEVLPTIKESKLKEDIESFAILTRMALTVLKELSKKSILAKVEYESILNEFCRGER